MVAGDGRRTRGTELSVAPAARRGRTPRAASALSEQGADGALRGWRGWLAPGQAAGRGAVPRAGSSGHRAAVRGLRDGRRSCPARKVRRPGWMAPRSGNDNAGTRPASGLVAIDQRVGNPQTERPPSIDRTNTIWPLTES
ncbi:hypothetical protein DP57_6327 [Burkholderia pseudomallei]|nr:hypothetical protein DP57_6327 [Burkholderia pseudomallei]